MNCNKAKDLLLSYLDNELSPLETVSIEDHLSNCPGCSAELEALAETKTELRQAFKTMAARVTPSPHVWENIKQQLFREEHRKSSILSPAKLKMKEWIGTMKLPRPVWQTLGALSVALLIVLSLMLPSSPVNSPIAADQMKKFSSYDELKQFVGEGTQSYYDYNVFDDNIVVRSSPSIAAGDAINFTVTEEYTGAVEYSTTNIQVQGVDEADIVKTDGEFIYLVTDGGIIIARAYPVNEAQVLAEIEQDNSIIGIFINGGRLVVIYQNYNNWDGLYYGNLGLFIPESAEMYVPQTYIKVYDVSDRSNPVLAREMSIDGNYFGSRMVGDYVYLIVNASALEQYDEIRLPMMRLDDKDVEIAATDIYYTNIDDYYYSFTTIAAVNIKEDEQEPEYETILLGASSNLYVSLNNIYVASTVWSEYSEKTAIQRIHTSGGDIEYEASGEVPGRVLNQFSMDEYNGFFRVATTTGYLSRSFEDATSQNNLYILDIVGLNTVSSLENLAPGEEIYSARFMGDRGYMVTFRKIDPLFVMDLTNPYEPEVLGTLKITGYSDYLHPYDENHLLGIGKETVAAEEGDFAWYQGVKISLFDVSDVTEPEEIAKYEIGDRGTDSPVLRDHKALLFDKTRNLMVIPVWLAEIDEAKYRYGEVPPYAYGDIIWQGVYIFDISDSGLQLKGRITHYDNPGHLAGSYYGADTIQRSLYITGDYGNILYTISEAKVGMNDLESLNELGEIELPLG